MRLKDWIAVVVLVLVAVVATHEYDGIAARDAAKASATVVYENGLLNCQGGNPTRKAQHEYFVQIAVGRAESARIDAAKGDIAQEAVDKEIASVAYHTARTYTDRFGARRDGTLICAKTVQRP